MMTKPAVVLTKLVGKGADAGLLKKLIQFVAPRMMDSDVKSLGRTNGCSVYGDRLWQILVGDVDLSTPKLRQGSYFPGILELRRTAKRAMAAVIQKTHIQCVSLSKARNRIKELC